MQVLSNMPAAYALDIHDGLRRTGFPPTPPMSAYLLAIAAGHIVGVTKQVCGKTGKVQVVGSRLTCRARLVGLL